MRQTDAVRPKLPPRKPGIRRVRLGALPTRIRRPNSRALLPYCLLLAWCWALTLAVTPRAAGQPSPVVVRWLAAQTNIHSWSADFVQTRTLKTLTQPTRETGRVWFSAPNRFRWELGQPAKTIAVRTPEELLLILYPRLRRVEKIPLTGSQTGPWREVLSLLEVAFPRNQAELQAQYNILSETARGGSCQVTLQPKSAAARRLMPQITIEFDPRDSSLRGTELQFADGSLMRNDFTNAVLNPEMNAKMFSPQIPDDYRVVEPLKRR